MRVDRCIVDTRIPYSPEQLLSIVLLRIKTKCAQRMALYVLCKTSP